MSAYGLLGSEATNLWPSVASLFELKMLSV